MQVSRIADDVDQCRSVEMAPLHQSGGRPEIDQLPGGVAHVGDGADGAAGEHFGLRNIRSDHACQGQQVTNDGLHGIITEQRIAALGHHDRVDDDVWQLVAAQGGSYRVDQCGRAEHTGLDGVAPDVGDDGIDLGRDDLGGDELHRGDGDGVLGGQCRDG